jgi:hypothetical protein
VVVGAVVEVDETGEVLDVRAGTVVTVVALLVAGGAVDTVGSASSPDLVRQAVTKKRKRTR